MFHILRNNSICQLKYIVCCKHFDTELYFSFLNRVFYHRRFLCAQSAVDFGSNNFNNAIQNNVKTSNYNRLDFSSPKHVDSNRVAYLNSHSPLIADQTNYSASINFSQILEHLDFDIKKKNRISLSQFEVLYSALKNSSAENLSPGEVQLALRCCGSILLEEIPEKRIERLHAIWNMLENKGFKFDISHYNAKLLVYSENEFDFDPTEYIAAMEKKGVPSNRVTYQRLLVVYCSRGDLKNAERTLEHMKQHGMPVNEYVYNALITGHLKTKDVEGAKNIFLLMKSQKIEPNASTFLTLMHGYALLGLSNDLDKTIDDMEKSGILFDDNFCLKVIEGLGFGGHDGLIPQYLDKIQKQSGYNALAFNTVVRLLRGGKYDSALKVYDTIQSFGAPHMLKEDNSLFLFRILAQNKAPVEDFLLIANRLKSLDHNTDPLLTAIYLVIKEQNFDLTVNLIKAYQKDNQEFSSRSNFFYPLLTLFAHNNDPKQLVETWKQSVDKKILLTNLQLAEFVVSNTCMSKDIILTALSEAGLQNQHQNYLTALVLHYLIAEDHGSLRQLLNDIKHPFVKFDSTLCSLIASAINTYPENVDLYVDVVAALKDDLRMFSSQILSEVAFICNQNQELLLHFLRSMHRKQIPIEPAICYFIERSLRQAILPEIKHLFVVLSSERMPPQPMPPIPRKQIFTRTELHLLEDNQLKERYEKSKSNGIPWINLLYILLDRFKNRDSVDDMNWVMNELRRSEHREIPIQAFADACYFYSKHQQLNEALEYKKLVQESGKLKLRDFIIVNIASLLLKSNQFDAAVELLAANRSINTVPETKDLLLQQECRQLLQSMVDLQNLDCFFKLIECLAKYSYISPKDSYFAPIIKHYLNSGNIAEAVKVFETIVKNYKCFPLKHELLCECFDNEDHISNIYEIIAVEDGELSAQNDLAFAFSEKGDLIKAKKLLGNTNFVLAQQKLDAYSTSLLNGGKVEAMENLLNATKVAKGVDLQLLYRQLMTLYGKQKNYKGALELWYQMQEEDLSVKDETLLVLEKILRENKQNVPFSAPKPPVAATADSGVDSTQLVLTLLQRDDVEGILKILRDHSKLVHKYAFSQVIDHFTKKRYLKQAFFAVESYSQRRMYPNFDSISFLAAELAKHNEAGLINNLKLMLPESFAIVLGKH